MKAFLDQPGFLGTYGTFGVDLTFVLAILFTALFMVGWYYARKARGNAHHGITLWAMLAMIGYFLFYYLSRQLGALSFTGGEGGQAGFGGPEMIYKWIFNPLLTIHIIIISIGLVLAFYMIPLGFRTSKRQEGRRVLAPGAPRGSGRAFTLKVLTYSIGLGILFPTLRSIFRGYFSARLYLDWIIVCVLIGLLVLLIEKIGNRYFPEGERRHRAIGGFTMVLYLVALITSAMTYVMLYVMYPPVAH